MSMICKSNGKCTATKGICVHETMMLLIVVLGIIGYFVFA